MKRKRYTEEQIISILKEHSDGIGSGAQVSSSAADTYFGSDGNIVIKNDTALSGHNREGYLKFDLSSITDPITAVSLDLTYSGSAPAIGSAYPQDDPSNYYIFGLNDGVGDNWNEGVVTWNNAPGNDIYSTNGVLGAETTLLGSFSLNFSSIIVGDVINFSSAGLLNIVQSDLNDLVTLIITRQEANWSNESFASKEYSGDMPLSPPTLHVTTRDSGPIPEPTTLALMGLGLAGIGWKRRKAA